MWIQCLVTVLVPKFFQGFTAVCCFTHRCGRNRYQFPLARLCAFLLLIRIGEASHPGPEDSCFILGVANPTGLRSKAPYVMSQMEHGDVWAFTREGWLPSMLDSNSQVLGFIRWLVDILFPSPKAMLGVGRVLGFLQRLLFVRFLMIGPWKSSNPVEP